ncbi:MAG: ABC transporter substrate-binding protein [Bacteroidota bacterium]
MISVPNRLQQLNGSKQDTYAGSLKGLLMCLLLICFGACDALKKVPQSQTPTEQNQEEDLGEIQGQKRYDPETGTYVHVTEITKDLDTVKWTDATATQNPPPITSEGVTPRPGGSTADPGNQVLSSYNVAILMPFLTNRFNELDGGINDKSMLALQFYSGAKLALEELSEEGVKLNVSVHDSEASERKTEELLSSSSLYNANMIIGPVRKDNLKLVADFAKANGAVHVSPMNPSTGVTKDNPYFVQVSPSLRSHCEAITRHIKDRFEDDQVVLVCRNKREEVARLKYFQNAKFAIEGSTLADRFKEYVVTVNSADYEEMDVTPYIQEGDTTVFVIPSFSNESFVYSFLRKVNLAKGNSTIYVYGMPQWQRYKRISFDYYEKLNVHISNSTYIDNEADKVRQFKQRFFDRFGTVPDEDAFIGYDVTKYFGQMISRHGTMFQDQLERYPNASLHTRFDFERILPSGSSSEDEDQKITRFENKHVNILKFQDYYFQLAR